MREEGGEPAPAQNSQSKIGSGCRKPCKRQSERWSVTGLTSSDLNLGMPLQTFEVDDHSLDHLSRSAKRRIARIEPERREQPE